MENKVVFIAGGTGYVGRRLVKRLLQKGCTVKCLQRSESKNPLPPGAIRITGNALDASTFRHQLKGCDTYIHLVGVAHPGPRKKEQFRSIDLESVKQAVDATEGNSFRHFIYMSVAQTPSGIMQDYQNARAEGEKLILATGIPATFVRPWYIVGPGHYWPLLLLPAYWLMALLPATRSKAKAFRLVHLKQVLAVLTDAVEKAPAQTRIIEVDDILDCRG
jgi:uncharacterized protein YbjT (DUF2867 family)